MKVEKAEAETNVQPEAQKADNEKEKFETEMDRLNEEAKQAYDRAEYATTLEKSQQGLDEGCRKSLFFTFRLRK